MEPRIVIDPNVRIAGGMTYAGFEDLLGLPRSLREGQLIEVVEPESELLGYATIHSIDHDRKLIELDVAWASLRPMRTASPSQTHLDGRRYVALGDHGSHSPVARPEIVTHPVLVSL